MPNPFLPAPNAGPRLQRAIRLPAPFAGPLGALAPVYAVAGGGGSAILYRVIALRASAAPVKSMEAGRLVSGVIIPRAYAGPRASSGVLIPRRRQSARGPGTPRFLRLQGGGALLLAGGDRLRLMEDDYS